MKKKDSLLVEEIFYGALIVVLAYTAFLVCMAFTARGYIVAGGITAFFLCLFGAWMNTGTLRLVAQERQKLKESEKQ